MEIFSRHLSDHNTNAVDMNAQIRRVLVDYRIQRADPTQPTHMATKMLSDTPEEPQENINSPLADDEPIVTLVPIQAVNNNINDLHRKLDSHICNTNMHFSSVKDSIECIKRRVSVIDRQTLAHLDDPQCERRCR